ncbi:Outer membrane protein beta-barrel domain-containing protein [Pedobacter suwonensis]|uniref:Outer membrane protein beta-barrel domain-containing protein n=1 Tax=Pedobacter suwonensis TaxID=332999 RepID=A0A1I0TT62_9SPHI|nr:outer membrane beta-barrel protein [Pedobacter suwonensis]SFA54887.1 Outer membrane protein beta-barrel domain-containing protein [Pedobacter suwonensis]
MKKKLILLGLAICTAGIVKAQTITKQEKGYFNLTEVGYTGGNHTYEQQVNPSKYEGRTSGAYAFSLRNINGVFLTNKISVGLGLGLENYTDDDSYFTNNNLFQLFLDARYYFKNQNNTFFAYGDAGTGLKIADDFRKGQMFNLGLGYKFKVAPKAGMTGSLGYSDQTIKSDPSITKNRYYGFAVKVGLLF